MSTRAVYTVLGEEQPIHIYIHSDGYPTGAADHIRNAFPHAWKLPRFEADEFAAALVAGNKNHWERKELAHLRAHFAQLERDATRDPEVVANIKACQKYQDEGFGGGGVRIFKGGPVSVIPKQAGDLEYRYEISCPNADSRSQRRGAKVYLNVKCFAVNYWDHKNPTEERLFDGSFEAFDAWAREKETA